MKKKKDKEYVDKFNVFVIFKSELRESKILGVFLSETERQLARVLLGARRVLFFLLFIYNKENQREREREREAFF